MPDSATTQFDDVYLNLSSHKGRLRLANSGLGWKSSGGSDSTPYTLPSSDIRKSQWSRASRGWELKFTLRNGNNVTFDGFSSEELENVRRAMKEHFDLGLDVKERSLKGWNWGKAKFEGKELVFHVENRPCFEVPLGKVTNTNLVGKNEVALEFALSKDGQEDGVSAKKRDALADELVEMRFYVPGSLEKEGKDASDGADSDTPEEESEISAAAMFYETLKDKASIGEVAGESICTFSEQFFITPRGRYDIDMFQDFLRLRGKTYDYKVNYDQVIKIFMLPKLDDVHVQFVVGLDPPLRQGQTRYGFLVVQFGREEEMEVELNLEEGIYQKEYASKLKQRYDAPAYEVVSSIFRGLTGKKVIQPGQFSSSHGYPGVKCALKANEGVLYCLDKYLLFLPKPPVLLDFDEISHVTFSRMAASVQATRTFDLTITLENGTTHAFLNVTREEQKNLEPYFKQRKIRIRNDLNDDSDVLLKKALRVDDFDESDSSDAGDRPGPEDSDEEEDEDFQEESEEDVAEEFDENAKGSSDEGGTSEEEDAVSEGENEEDAVSEGENEEEERPKKKAKKT